MPTICGVPAMLHDFGIDIVGIDLSPNMIAERPTPQPRTAVRTTDRRHRERAGLPADTQRIGGILCTLTADERRRVRQ
jgi:hypothetical protein